MIKKKAVRKYNDKEDKKSRRIPLKKYTKGGKTASLMALCNLIIILITIAIAILQKGNAGIYVGFLMLAVLISAAAGFIIGINSFKEENKFLRYTYIGTISNAVIWIGILGIYLIFV